MKGFSKMYVAYEKWHRELGKDKAKGQTIKMATAEASNYIFIKLDNFFMPCKMPFRCTTKAIAGFYEGKQC
jgi:hypothetical protein